LKEQTIFASFLSTDNALAAQKELQQKGFSTTQVDRIGKYSTDSDADYDNPLSGNITNTGLSEYSGENRATDVGPLLAADNAVSGYATDTDLANQQVLLTIVAPKDKVDTAIEVIKKHEGYLIFSLGLGVLTTRI